MRILFLLAVAVSLPSLARAADTVVGPPSPKTERYTTVSHDEERSSSRLQLAGLALGAAGLDYWSTQRGRAAGLSEANPAMGDGGTVLLVGKGVAASAYVLGVPMLERRKPRLGRAVKWGVPLVWSAIAVVNERTRARALAGQ